MCVCVCLCVFRDAYLTWNCFELVVDVAVSASIQKYLRAKTKKHHTVSDDDPVKPHIIALNKEIVYEYFEVPSLVRRHLLVRGQSGGDSSIIACVCRSLKATSLLLYCILLIGVA
jgi:hypothetical protein